MRKNINNKDAENNLLFCGLNDDQCKMIYDAACRLLEIRGWELKNDINGRAAKVLAEAGCTIVENMVHFPRQVVERALACVPKELTVYDQLGNPCLVMSADNRKCYTAIAPSPTYVRDIYTGERRMARTADAYNTGLVGDSLDNIDMLSGLAWVSDCPKGLEASYEIRELLKASNKPIQIWGSNQNDYATVMEMCSAVAGGEDAFREKPFAATFCGNFNNADFLMDLLESGAVMHTMSDSGIRGVNVPVTMAGIIVKCLAETLTVFVLAQQIRPGYPIIGGLGTNDTNFENLSIKMTSPHQALAVIAAADIYRYLGLPASLCSMGSTSSMGFDGQTAFDYAAHLLTAKYCGLSLTFAGHLENCNTGSLEALIYTDEILSYANQVTSGIKVNEETLAEEVLMRVGPGGSFVAEEHTLDNLDLWMPRLFTTQHYEAWAKEGNKDTGTRANEKVKEIIKQGVRNPKSAELLAKFDEIIARAVKGIGESS